MPTRDAGEDAKLAGLANASTTTVTNAITIIVNRDRENRNTALSDDIDHSPRHPQCLSPKAGRGMHQLYDLVDRVDEFIELRSSIVSAGATFSTIKLFPQI
jgi:hypothetical protein